MVYYITNLIYLRPGHKINSRRETMYLLESKAFLQFSNIGKHITLQLKDETVFAGTLLSISADCLTILDAASGLNRDISSAQISYIELGTAQTRISSEDISRFLRSHDKMAKDPKTTIVDIFRKELLAFAEKCQNESVRSYLTAECDHCLTAKSPLEVLEVYKEYESYTGPEPPDALTDSCIRAMMLMRMCYYSRAFVQLLPWLMKQRTTGILMLACFYTQMNHHISTLFWLNKYFPEAPDKIKKENRTWWFYLWLCSRFASYETVGSLLPALAETNAPLALESLLYLLLLNQSRNIALNVFDAMVSGLSDAQSAELIRTCTVFLVSDPDNNYHRYEKCMKAIFASDTLQEYDDNEQINGFIYEYVPDKKFGFIVGDDLLTYFFREESVSKSVMNDIRSNINAFLPVEEESLCPVSFRRFTSAKRSYAATHIF